MFTRRLVYFGINVNFNLFRKYFATQADCGAGETPNVNGKDAAR